MFFSFRGCNKDQHTSAEFYKMYGNVADDAGTLIEKLARHKIIFGHQSVGFNILEGLENWKQESRKDLQLVDTRDFSYSDDAFFIHFAVGKNRDPKLKVNDFVSQVETLSDITESVAFFKFCYVDFDSSSNVDDLFDYYKKKMLYLRERKPNCKIILFTVPLTGIQSGLKGLVKSVINRPRWGELENIKRNEFNEKILSFLSDEFDIFDLAALESTHPDGKRETYIYDDQYYPCMLDLYTDDLGHLNDFGAKMVSYNMLAFLSETLSK